MKEYEKFMEEAEKRDHRKIGVVGMKRTVYLVMLGTRAVLFS
jgi:hypothetical protein